MLPHNVIASTDRLTVAAVRRAWSQWASVGALAAGSPQTANEIVDIEALILGSLGLARRESRLRTIVTDWTVTNSELVSIARLRALLAGPFAGLDLSVSEFAYQVSHTGGDARWRALHRADGLGEQERAAKREQSRKAMPPRWRDAHTLLLQLRRGLGVGVKPDLLAILLGSQGGWLEVSTLCELSGYSIAGARRAADEMANAGFVETSGGHGKAFRAQVPAWQALLPNIGQPVWRRRADGFALVLKWQEYIHRKSASHDSELSLAISFGKQMTDFWRLWLEVGVTQEPVSDIPGNAWASRADAIDRLVKWFEDRKEYGDGRD